MKLVFVTYSKETNPSQIDNALDSVLGDRVLKDKKEKNVKSFFVRNDSELDNYLTKIKNLFKELKHPHYEVSQPIDLPGAYS